MPRSAPPEDGLQVYAEGRPTLWEERGEFRITVKKLIPTDAEGQWELRLQQAKAALERDGLLDPARRRPLPAGQRHSATDRSRELVVGKRRPTTSVP